MSLFTLILLAFSMSMDAFAVAICKGASSQTISVRNIIFTALIFGIVETITPLIGWLVGHTAQSLIADYDHWIAFTLLAGLGGRMIRESLSPHDDNNDNNQNPNQTTCCQARQKQGFIVLLLMAVATSIDSMVVGVSLAFLNVDIWVTALSIGATTTLMSVLGISVGKWLGNKVGKRAECVGGIVLIMIGAFILYEHLYLG